MRRAVCCSACVVVAAFGVLGHAQGPTPPPKVLRIFEENVKVGKEPAHEKVEIAWQRAFAAAKVPIQILAMKAIAGPPQAWFISPFDSMADVERAARAQDKLTAFMAQNDAYDAQDADLVNGRRTLLAVFRDDLSYAPANAAPVPKLRYFDVEIFQTRPGHTAEFVESRKIGRAAHQKASMPDSSIMYEVVAGAASGTFIRFRGVQALGDQDRYDEAHRGNPFRDAMMADQKRADELTASSVINTQHTIFEFDPKMSYMAKEFTSADPDFWTPKPKMSTANAPAAPAAAPEPAKAKK